MSRLGWVCNFTCCVITTAVRVVVPEGDEALLPCSLSTKEDLTRQLFDWRKDGQKEVFLYNAGSHYNNGRQGQDEQFKGRVFHFEDKLKNGDASITIRNTKVADSGNYTCDFPRHQPRQTFLIELVVGRVLRDRSGEISGAAKPSVKTLHQSETWALLQCKVPNARPEPTVKWQDSNGNKLPDKERDVTKSGDHFSVVLLTNVTKTDNFSCVVTQEDISHQTEAEIDVRLSGAAPEPVRVVVPEGDEALLPCSLSTKEDLTLKLFDWRKDGQKEVFLYEAGSHYNNGRQGQDKQFKGRVFHFEDKLKNGDASITIRNTKVADSGNYTCDFPHHQPPQTFLIELVVGRVLRDRSGEISGAAEPSVTNLNETETWALLLCKVLNAHPEPTVKWQDSAGNKLPDKQRDVIPSGDRFNVILRTNVTKTDNYHCVVTQEEISHQAASKIYVRLSEEPHSLTTGVIVGGAVGLLVVGFVVGGIAVFCIFKVRSRRPY
uniref:butyrophilin-like protein 2 isoform X2 n=1 Tax=Scatophagus argus TaxID=75038 RepID=UPI001ED82378|nr:butyrophilin-like protein 2 isoform X2 [Scatophagus argus]